MGLLAHLAPVQRLASVLEMHTAKAIGTQTLVLHHLHLVFSRHGLELSTNVEGVLLGDANWTAAANIWVSSMRDNSAKWLSSVFESVSWE